MQTDSQELDSELNAINKVMGILSPLNEASRQRVLTYLMNRLGKSIENGCTTISADPLSHKGFQAHA